MAAERVKQAPEPEAPASEPEVPKRGRIKSFLPLLATLLLMPAVAWVMTEFVLIPRLQKSLGIAPAKKAVPAAQETGSETNAAAAEKLAPRQSVALTKLLVNVAGTMGSRYLLSSITLVGVAPDFKGKVEKHEPQLRDAAMTLLSTKTISDLEKPGARNMVRSELIAGFNNVLGGGTVLEIYITEFAIQ